MIILTTLKQKDLAAVSAQQLLHDASNRPQQINRFDLYDIQGSFSDSKLIQAVKASYIFANPNKHHLILDSSHFSSPRQLFFKVSRKSPLNLSSKIVQLNQKLAANAITSITLSELWAFTYSADNYDQLNINDIKDTLIVSSSMNKAPFAHPLIHNVDAFLSRDINKKLGFKSH